jgi:flagellar hook-associated protein 1
MMAGLSSALSSALSGLLVTAGQSALVSKNVTRAGDANFSRRDVELSLARDGTVRLGTYSRSADQGLQDQVLRTSSQVGHREVNFDALSKLTSLIGDPQDDTSITSSVFKLQQSLRSFQNNPSNKISAETAVADSQTLVSRLNTASNLNITIRREANEGIEQSVQTIRQLLTDLEGADTSIRTGKPGTEIYNDDLDKRDSILRQLSNQVGLRSVAKANGGIALYTDSGITLFDGAPRVVEVRPSGLLLPGSSGSMVFIDGVQVSGSNSKMPIVEGILAAQIKVRDEITVVFQTQLDETARSLITLFAESDQNTPSVLPPATGLFTYSGSPGIPTAATHTAGLAGQITINRLFEKGQGGNPQYLRDGGANGTAYIYNIEGQSGFQDRLAELVDALDAPFNFSPSAGIETPSSLKEFTERTASHLTLKKANASIALDQARADKQRWTDASLRATGVNLDEEMASLLSLEKSYQASARVMTTIDQMFATLIEIVR